MKAYFPNTRWKFYYTNYKGERELRYVTFTGLDYGCNSWYPEPQWFMRTHDEVRSAARSFALNRIEADTIEAWNGD